MSGRRARVEQALRDALAEMIDREVKDPRVRGAGLVTVQRVELTADLSVARVYVSVFGDEAAGRRAVAGLAAAAGFLRGPLGRRLNLQKPPELRFLHDHSPEMAAIRTRTSPPSAKGPGVCTCSAIASNRMVNAH